MYDLHVRYYCLARAEGWTEEEMQDLICKYILIALAGHRKAKIAAIEVVHRRSFRVRSSRLTVIVKSQPVTIVSVIGKHAT